ncbi:helix-turn-helix domain-containing protein [Listeria rustica]|uniref:Crp/Fnr family transcriptional regulator n=1 Tax=Listeria rustica TaxID=2713503 RepID=A0A7W1T6C3_9LIST|nr:helix-turn-helix domain-containing protein [Listeria rustica]MBA3926317.1 Crp/Fnr family transcriptional regulator [Listeria rustica]
MSLTGLYSSNNIQSDFQSKKLLEILLDDQIFPIKKKHIVFGKSDKIVLTDGNNSSSIYVYAVEKGMGALILESNIIDFIGEDGFIGLHHSNFMNDSKLHAESLTGELVTWRFELQDVLAKIINMQEGYLYHYNYMRETYERYTMKLRAIGEDNDGKVAMLLYSIASWFGIEAEEKDFVELPKIFTRKVLANYMGISHTTLSTVIRELARQGEVISKSQRLLVRVKKR